MVMVTELHNRRVIRVPDVVGQPLGKARMVMSNAGLQLDAVLFRESYEEKNTVLEQTPGRGQMVYEGSRITLYVARRGYMELLPAIYRRSDAVGRNLVRDICFIFEHMFGSVDEVLDRGHSYYDPLECPPEFLPWLASWTAMVLDVGWPIEKKRALLKRSVDLYRIRGTTRGLALFLKLFIGHEPIIEENKWPFRGFRVGVDARVGIDTVVLPPVNLAHCFTVTVPIKFTDVTPEMVVRVHEIIQMEKPAHVQYYLRFAADEGDAQLREFFAIGLRSGIGIADEIVHLPEPEPAAPEVEEPDTAPAAVMPQPVAAQVKKAEVRKPESRKAESKPPEPKKPEGKPEKAEKGEKAEKPAKPADKPEKK
jgi:phage tail-like protein